MPKPAPFRQSKYLDLRSLQRLSAFRFSPRRRLQGMYWGRHPTDQRGQSVEFRDYRQYMPGDDVATVDWKVLGRSDKLYVKVFENETELSVTLLLDCSASMAYRGERQWSKFDVSCQLAAAMAFLILGQQDRVAFGLAHRGLASYLPPSRTVSQLPAILMQMHRTRAENTADVATAIDSLAGKMRRGEVLIVLSDLWEPRPDILRSVSRVTYRGAEVLLIHILHDDEMELPPGNSVRMKDSETMQQLNVDLDELRENYRKQMQGHLANWRTACVRSGIDYHLVSSCQPYHQVLEEYLRRRSATG